MQPRYPHLLAGGVALAALLIGPAAAQTSEGALHEAYYLEHEKGDLAGALKLYRSLADNRRVSEDVRAEALRRAAGCQEELACSDFAQLMPEEAIVYIEFNRPGDQLSALLDQLGLLKDGDASSFGVSPLLLEGALGMRGAAVAITQIDPTGGPPNGVLVLHPGDLDLVRGMIETALPVGGRPSDSIGGFPTYDVEGEVLVTLTSRLVIASPDRSEIQGVISRLNGNGRGSLAQNEDLAGSMSMRGEDLMFFCLNAEPVMPMIEGLVASQSRQDPELAMAMSLLDVQSTRSLAGRVGIDSDGLSIDLALDLAEGHRNLAFNLMRMPHIDRDTLRSIPAGVAFFVASSLNPSGPVPNGATDSRGAPVVTAMDFGRELFSNISDIAIYGMPSVSAGAHGPMPDVALSVTVNDPKRSRALWNFVLGIAKGATGGGTTDPSTSRVAGVDVERYDIEGVSVFLAMHENQILVSPSQSAIESSIEARRAGHSVLEDKAFAKSLAHIDEGATWALAVNAGRAGDIARHFMSEGDQREIMPFMQMLRETTFSAGVQHSETRYAINARLCGIPDVSGMVSQLVAQEMGHSGNRSVVRAQGNPWQARSVAAQEVQRAEHAEALLAAEHAEKEKAGHAKNENTGLKWDVEESALLQDRDQLVQHFEHRNAEGKDQEAAATLERIAIVGAEDAFFLNNLAWAVLTEEQYGGKYKEIATRMSKASNESSGWNNWYYLDTYAYALADRGELEKAIEIQKKAVAIAHDTSDPRVSEAEAPLEKYLAAHAARPVSSKGEAYAAEHVAKKKKAEDAYAKAKKAEVDQSRAALMQDLQETFGKLNADGHTEAAAHVGREIFKLSTDEAQTLNDFAWGLLTEDVYGGNYNELALEMSKRSNEISEWGNWFYLDTLAHGLFLTGDVKKAIEVQKKAVDIGHAQKHERVGEAEAALERFMKAAQESKQKTKRIDLR